MGFLAGRVAFERFAVGGRQPGQFGEPELEILRKHAIGGDGLGGQAAGAEGVQAGFAGGAHILDVDFALEKNVVNDALAFAMRVDSNKPPGDLFRAYQQQELAVLSADNPSGYPTRRQKQEAKEAAEQRLTAQAETGMFRRMKMIPALWDARQNIVYFGSGATGAVDRFVTLFKDAFGCELSRLTAGSHALAVAEERGAQRALEDLAPAPFAMPSRKVQVAWVNDQFGSRDFLGNEFLVWLWWVLDTQSDTLKLPDDSAVTVMLNRTLSLECPFAETGKETITHEAPTQLPEARRALLAGKLPRKAGMALVRHDETYELTLQAESLAVSGAALPKLDSGSPRAEQEDRVDQLRHLTETLDLLFALFCRRRLAAAWREDVEKIRLWLPKDDSLPGQAVPYKTAP